MQNVLVYALLKSKLKKYGLNDFIPQYDEETQYSVGEYVVYKGNIYKALTATSGGMFNPAEWDRLTIAEALRYIDSTLPKKADLGADGRIIVSQLPEFVIADVVKVQTYADLPSVGDSGKVYYVENDPDATKNGSYKWIGDQYYKYTNEQNYYNVSIVGENYTMGQLEETVTNINQAGQHVLFDLHSFATDAYVCLIHFFGTDKCVIFDMLNGKVYGIGQSWTDSQLVSNYVLSDNLDLFSLQSETWTFTLEDNTTVTKNVFIER